MSKAAQRYREVDRRWCEWRPVPPGSASKAVLRQHRGFLFLTSVVEFLKPLDFAMPGPQGQSALDVDKQCAVELSQGGQCRRNLAFRTHGFSAKRAVPGRSAPFDQLLEIFQRQQ